MEKSILIVEDEADMLFLLSEAFSSIGYTVYKAKNGEEGLESFYKNSPKIIITDILMPSVNGLDMVRTIRQINKKVPIFFLTSLTSASDAVLGLTSGADDYIRKPFPISEVIARVNVALERSSINTPQCYKLASYTFDPARHSLSRGGKDVKLTGRQSNLLQVLARNMGQVVTIDEIIRATYIKQKDYFAARSLQVHIVKLRQLLADDPDISIINERGIGYRLVDYSIGQ